MASHVLGISYYLPEGVETNADLGKQNPSWQMERLYEKSGISSRHIAAPEQTASDLGYEAARKLLDRNLVSSDQIDYLIYCTQSPDYFLPPGACILQNRLGLGKHVGAFDFNLGCSGFIYGLQLADALVRSGQARNVMLVTADTYSKYIHPNDRSVRTLFGDGAAATLIGASEGPGRIGQFVVGTDGGGASRLVVPGGGHRKPRSAQTAVAVTDSAGCVRSEDNLFMDGPALFTFALMTVPRLVNDLLKKAQLTIDQVDWYVYHQANKYMLDNLIVRCKVPREKAVYDFETIGNTVSSTIPIAIADYEADGRIKPGHRLMLIGFGVGFSWAACDMVWG